jgi:hypothetical protein
MRLYISKRMNGPRYPIYEFCQPIKIAMFWDSREQADSVCQLIAQDGIMIRQCFGLAVKHCTDFRVEQRPGDGFSVSCEAPV